MESLFVYLTTLSSNIAYLIIFGILVACGLGFPLPEDIPLIAAGYLVWDGTMEWLPAIFITMLGVVIGDSILFFIGRKLGLKILDTQRFQRIFRKEKIRRTRAYFRKYGDKIVFFARFVAGFRAIAFFLAGAMRMRYSRFILLDSLAALVSVPVWILIGYALGHYLGDQISEILASVKHLKNGLTLVITFIVVVVVVQQFLKYKRATATRKRLRPAAKPRV